MKTAALTSLLLAALAAPRAGAVVITEKPLAAEPGGISAGLNTFVYFTEGSNLATLIGSSVQSNTPAGAVSFSDVVSTLDALWAGDSGGNQIFMQAVVGGGGWTPIPIPTANAGLAGMCAGPDGNVWFTEYGANKIGRVTRTGTVTEFTIPTAASGPMSITAGGDGALWFVEYIGNKLGRINTDGFISEYTIPTAGSHPTGVAALGGYIAFTESSANQIGHYNVVTHSFHEYAVPTAGATPWAIVRGPDLNFYFTEWTGNAIGRMSIGGSAQMKEYPVPTAAAVPLKIALGPDGSIWFTEAGAHQLGRLQISFPGDVNADGKVDVGDAFYLINFLFAGGSAPK